MSLYSVDAITPGTEWPARPGVLALVRMVHYSEKTPGGLCYVMAEPDCVAPDGEKEPGDLEFAHGRTYNVNMKGLTELRKKSSIRRTPVLSFRQMQDLFERDADVESDLTRRVRLHFSRAERVSELSELRTDRRSARPPDGKATLHVLKVGQGEAVLLTFPDGQVWLIDAYFWAREAYRGFLDFLEESTGERRIDRMVLTHFHYDHIRYAGHILEELSPAELYIPHTLPHSVKTVDYVLSKSPSTCKVRTLGRSLSAHVAGVNVCLTQSTEIAPELVGSSNPNDHCILMTISCGVSFALLAADAPGSVLDRLLNVPHIREHVQGASQRIYKVAHHCSNTGLNRPFLETLRPTEAVTSCGSGNRYRHPHTETCELIKETLRGNGRHRITYLHGTASYSL